MIIYVSCFFATVLAVSVPSVFADSVESCLLKDGQHGKCLSITECERIHQVKESWSIESCASEYFVCCPVLKNKIRLPKDPGSFVFLEKKEDTSESAAKKSAGCGYYKNACPCSRVPDGAGVFTGGISASPYELPHMAAIGYGPENDIVWQCGGSLISENFVLTAAHCLNDGMHPAAWVRLGTVIIQDKTRENVTVSIKGQTHPVLERIVHPEYKAPAKYNDIALLKIGPALEADSLSTLNHKIHPACLQVEHTLPYIVFGSGWGRLGPFDVPAPSLQMGPLNIYDSSECNKTFELEIKTTNQLQKGIQDSQVCAGQIEGGVDTCQGDSGGPLQVQNGFCIHTVVGVTSFGKICGYKNSLGVYTRVSYYLRWIEENIWKNREACLVDTDRYGECIPLSKCIHIHDYVRRGYRPTQCGYNQEEPIVCCPSPNQEIWVPPSKNSTQPSRSRVPGEAAKEWCKKYKQELKYSESFQEGLPKERNHYPHMALVGYGELKFINWQCAGSLISRNFVLIAAHCLINDKCEPAKWISLGVQTFKSDVRHTSKNGTVTGQVHPIIGVAVHPEYEESTRVNNLALIQIGDPIEADASSTMSPSIHPACLQVSVEQIQEAQLVGMRSYARGDDFEHYYVETNVIMSNVTSCSFNSKESVVGKEEFSKCTASCPESCPVTYQGSLQILIDQDSQLYEIIGIKSSSKYTSVFYLEDIIFTHIMPYLGWIEDYVWPA